MTKILTAYHGKPATKAMYLKRLRAHAKSDELVQGTGWADGKGCAIGCAFHTYDHAAGESLSGIPQMVLRLEDVIFEGLPNELAMKWPVRFMSAIKPGADLGRVGWLFLHWTLTDPAVNPGITHPMVAGAVRQCADIVWRIAAGEDPASLENATALAARSAARSAASAASAANGASRANDADRLIRSAKQGRTVRCDPVLFDAR